jgi:hypothetical protein
MYAGWQSVRARWSGQGLWADHGVFREMKLILPSFVGVVVV